MKPVEALVTFRPGPSAQPGVRGQVIAVELIPDDYLLQLTGNGPLGAYEASGIVRRESGRIMKHFTLLEEGDPRFDSVFVGTQTVDVA